MTTIRTDDIRSRPAYTARDAAQFLRMPVSTVRSWAFGHGVKTATGTRFYEPVIVAADPEARLLSFLNLVELLVLKAIRRKHSVSMPKVRSALDFLRKKLPTPHPLADHRFQTNGVDLFIEHYGSLLNLSRNGQFEMRELIAAYLQLVERDDRGLPVRLWLPRTDSASGVPSRSGIVIDPRFGFGRPTVSGSGIRADVLAERFQAGESVEELADDYNLPPRVIEDALRIHPPLAA